jgi:hypothetical protein
VAEGSLGVIVISFCGGLGDMTNGTGRI